MLPSFSTKHFRSMFPVLRWAFITMYLPAFFLSAALNSSKNGVFSPFTPKILSSSFNPARSALRPASSLPTVNSKRGIAKYCWSLGAFTKSFMNVAGTCKFTFCVPRITVMVGGVLAIKISVVSIGLNSFSGIPFTATGMSPVCIPKILPISLGTTPFFREAVGINCSPFTNSKPAKIIIASTKFTTTPPTITMRRCQAGLLRNSHGSGSVLSCVVSSDSSIMPAIFT